MQKTKFKLFVFLVLNLCLLRSINSKNLSEDGISSKCCDDNTITVNGVGKVSVIPDIAYITVIATFQAKTTGQATDGLANAVTELIQKLKEIGIPRSDIRTQSININPKYDYPEGIQVFAGYIASQTLIVTVRGIDENGERVGTVIDQIVIVKFTQYNGLRFDKENKSDAIKLARKIAFNDAIEKATDIACLLRRTLGKALSVIDSTTEASSTFPAENFGVSFKSSNIPTGDLDIQYNLNIKYSIK